MKKTLIFLICIILVLSISGCGSQKYLNWTSSNYMDASSSQKLNCAEAFVNELLEQNGENKLSGDELTSAAIAMEDLLESRLSENSSKTVGEIAEEYFQ